MLLQQLEIILIDGSVLWITYHAVEPPEKIETLDVIDFCIHGIYHKFILEGGGALMTDLRAMHDAIVQNAPPFKDLHRAICDAILLKESKSARINGAKARLAGGDAGPV